MSHHHRPRHLIRPGASILVLGLTLCAAACSPGAQPAGTSSTSGGASGSISPSGPGDSAGSADPQGSTAFRPVFGESGLVTNEVARRLPVGGGAHVSPDWVVTSGSLFADHGAGWTGRVDAAAPDPESSRATNSAVFRLISRRQDFAGVEVSFQLRVDGMPQVPGRAPQNYDGVHVWVRYQDPSDLYAISILRRDGTTAIKRKLPRPATSTTAASGSEAGDYTTLATGRMTTTPGAGEWERVVVRVEDVPAGVRLTASLNGIVVVSATDTAPDRITRAGAVGLRGDATEFHFRDFAAVPVQASSGS